MKASTRTWGCACVAKPALFWDCGPLTGSRICLPFPSLSTPWVCLRSCFIAWSACSPATSACFTVLCGQTHTAFAPTSDALLMPLAESSASQHILPSCCLVWKSGISDAATYLITMSQGEGASWLLLCLSTAALEVVARARAQLEPSAPPATDKVTLHLSYLWRRFSNLHYGHFLSSFSLSHVSFVFHFASQFIPMLLCLDQISPSGSLIAVANAVVQ